MTYDDWKTREPSNPYDLEDEREEEQDDKQNSKSATEIIDELTYRSYRQQRILAPDVEPQRWAIIYGSAVEMFEKRWQEEKV